jgi:hypothetical protein
MQRNGVVMSERLADLAVGPYRGPADIGHPTRQRGVRLERATTVTVRFTCQAFSSEALPRSEDSKLAVILSLTEKPSADASS